MQQTAVPQRPLYRVAVRTGLVPALEVPVVLAVFCDTVRLHLAGLGETESSIGVASPPPRKSETQDFSEILVKIG